MKSYVGEEQIDEMRNVWNGYVSFSEMTHAKKCKLLEIHRAHGALCSRLLRVIDREESRRRI